MPSSKAAWNAGISQTPARALAIAYTKASFSYCWAVKPGAGAIASFCGPPEGSLRRGCSSRHAGKALSRACRSPGFRVWSPATGLGNRAYIQVKVRQLRGSPLNRVLRRGRQNRLVQSLVSGETAEWYLDQVQAGENLLAMRAIYPEQPRHASGRSERANDPKAYFVARAPGAAAPLFQVRKRC